MKITIKTPLTQTPQQIFARFDSSLFLALNPPIIPVKLLRFDGCQKNHQIHIQLPFNTLWISLITHYSNTPQEIYFIDEGIKLPFPLKKWTHKHQIIAQNQTQTLIVDHIEYTTQNTLLNYLLYPILYLQFAYRKPIYKKWFA